LEQNIIPIDKVITAEDIKSEDIGVKLLDIMVRRRIFKDEDIDALFLRLKQAYPNQEERLRDVMVDVIAALES